MHEFRLAVPDPYLITFIALSLFSFFEYFKKKKIKFLILFYFFVALGSLTKGPVAILLPGLSVGLFLLLKKELKIETKTDGLSSPSWVIIDTGDIMIHLFHKDAREYYQLESLWSNAGKQ